MPTGIILLDKPQGLTSNGALQQVRKRTVRERGYVGTSIRCHWQAAAVPG